MHNGLYRYKWPIELVRRRCRNCKYNGRGGVGALMGPTLSMAVSGTYGSLARNYISIFNFIYLFFNIYFYKFANNFIINLLKV